MNITIKSKIEELEKMRQAIQNFANMHGINTNEAYQITLAIDEICTNIIEHGFKNIPHYDIEIAMYVENRQFIIEIHDESAPFDMRDFKKLDIKKHISNYNVGGLGIFIVTSIMDEINYQPIDELHQYNKLTLVKNII